MTDAMPLESHSTAYAPGDLAARDSLLTRHLSLVHRVARQLSPSLAAQADFNDLISCGTIGLMKAVDDFEPARGLAFSTFAVPRIRGAILDGLRQQDHVPRSVRRRSRALSRAKESLTHLLRRAPTEGELARRLGISLQTLWAWQADHEAGMQRSLDELVFDPHGQGGQTLESVTPDERALAEALLNREQEVACLQRALSTLKEQERTVLTLYYFEELKLHEIATILGVTESRASQVRTKALARLRTLLGALRSSA